ncbi:hypothetical protein EAF00_006903 [Botryotinia globosa]|nr:hypothetical protein EAF00_006903 [Botryotinia globosa]
MEAKPPRLLKELRSLPDNVTWTQLEQMPYLSAVVQEGSRLAFGVTARTARVSYEPLTHIPSHIKSYAIPPGTPVSTTTLSAHTATSIFPDPFILRPERWLRDDGRVLGKFLMTFGKGERKCLGIELARAELLLATAALARKFEMKLWNTDEINVAFVHDWQVFHPKIESDGVMIIVEMPLICPQNTNTSPVPFTSSLLIKHTSDHI